MPTGAARDVPEIREALERLARFEASAPAHADPDDFAEAIALLDAHLDEVPDSPHRGFIANLRLAHTRRLLQRLVAHPQRDAFGAIGALALLVDCVRPEAEALLRESAELRRGFEVLSKAWPGLLGPDRP